MSGSPMGQRDQEDPDLGQGMLDVVYNSQNHHVDDQANLKDRGERREKRSTRCSDSTPVHVSSSR
jgi:hypothetical protein